MNTMVFTHLPSNVFLLLVPLMPTPASAVIMLLARFSISQMDVPARQAYVTMVVASDERSAANGITNIARTVGLSVSPLVLAPFLRAHPTSIMFFSPFFIAGGLKIIYDLAIYGLFKATRRLGAETTVIPVK
jgi:sugar phosphate permease